MRHLLFVAVGLLSIAAAAFSQSPEPGTIRGSVLDQAGKAIPNASVTIKEDASGTTRKLTSDVDGRFSAAGLPAGTYSVEAFAPGFAVSTHTGVKLTATGAEDVSISLSVASLAQA